MPPTIASKLRRQGRATTDSDDRGEAAGVFTYAHREDLTATFVGVEFSRCGEVFTICAIRPRDVEVLVGATEERLGIIREGFVENRIGCARKQFQSFH
jgi:hypothetical protein